MPRFALLVLLVAPAWSAGGVFNILDYGARNDGSAPATEAIRTAVQAAKAAGGGTVFIPAGIYVSGPVVAVHGAHEQRTQKLLGAGKLTACDTDPVSVEIAGQGFVGSVDAVAAGAMDLVMANISPEAITALAGDLLRVRKPGGVLLASGFEAHEVEQVCAALPDAREVRHKGKWALVAVGGPGLSDNEDVTQASQQVPRRCTEYPCF
jgi:hypothetical protein